MTRHPGTFAAGFLFLLVGGAYLLEALGVWTVDPGRVWPILLIGVGLVIVAASWSRQEDRPATPPPPSGDDPTV